eukprot:s1706_g6.t1
MPLVLKHTEWRFRNHQAVHFGADLPEPQISLDLTRESTRQARPTPSGAVVFWPQIQTFGYLWILESAENVIWPHLERTVHSRSLSSKHPRICQHAHNT